MTRTNELVLGMIRDFERGKLSIDDVLELRDAYESELARAHAALRGIHTILSESGMPLSATRCGDILALLHSAWPDDVDGLTGCADDQTYAGIDADELREAAASALRAEGK